MSRKRILLFVVLGAVIATALWLVPRASREGSAKMPSATEHEQPSRLAAPPRAEPKPAPPAAGPITLASTFVRPSSDALRAPAQLIDLTRVETGAVLTAEARVTLPAAQGCRAVRADGECEEPLPGDADRDGHATAQDCDDTLSQVHAGAAEVRCNQLDEDCDGEDFCPPDDDGDHVHADEDCDDTNAARTPFAEEVPCN